MENVFHRTKDLSFDMVIYTVEGKFENIIKFE